MLDKIIHHIQSHKRFHIIWLLIITAIAILYITGLTIGDKEILEGLRVDNSMEVWYLEDDPGWVQYKRFQKHFEGDEFIIIAFKMDDIFKPEVLAKIKDMTGRLEELPYVTQVTSLTNADEFRGDEGLLEIRELFEDIPDDPAAIAKRKEWITNHTLYEGNVVSADGKTTAILIRVAVQPSGVNYQREITDLILDLCERESEGGKYKFYITGFPIVVGMEERATTEDAGLEYPLSAVFLILILYLLHRRIVLVMIPMGVVGLATIWIHGVIPMYGSTYNMITAIIGSLVAVIGIADSIHYIHEYNLQIRTEEDSHGAVRKAFRLVVLPCLFTTLTTAVGFMSFQVSQLKGIKEFGIFVGIAMVMTFVINMVLVSVSLSKLKKRPMEIPAIREDGILQRSMRWAASINRRHVKVNLFIALIVFLTSFIGISKIEINTNDLEFFRKSHPIRIATDFVEENLTGTFPIEIMLTGRPGTFKDPDVLRRMEKLEDFIGSMDRVRKTFSMVDYLKEMNGVLHDEKPEYYRIPGTENKVSQLLLLAEGEKNELEHYVDVMDFSVARIHGSCSFPGSNEMKEISDPINQKIEELFGDTNIKAEVCGTLPMYLNAMDYVVDSQVQGFSLALVGIFIMLTLLVRSFKLGLLAMVPNLIPVALTMGIMGWANIYLDMGTVLIASVAIGLAVDDTIHFIARFRHAFDKTQNYDAAIDETLLDVGAPIAITSVVLFFGFGICLISTFLPVAYFGILAATTMVSALIADLFVLPALIKVFKPFGPERGGVSS